MLQKRILLAVAAATLVLVGCGGGGSGTPAPRIEFTSQVVFGDSLSDVGTYAVDGVASRGGGRYTINQKLPDGSPKPTNWTELIAIDLGVAAPCAAETGLEGFVFNAPIEFHTPDCTNYAQGGSMVTYPFGVGNVHVGLPPNGNPYEGSSLLGQLTVPIVTQIQNHLDAHGGAFSGTEIVFILAGGNDAITNTSYFMNDLLTGPEVIQAMALAGQQLADYVNTMILGKGAKYVVVLNLPDLSITPFGALQEQARAGTKTLISDMVTTFNDQLAQNITSPNVVLLDLRSASVEQFNNPGDFDLTNVTATACDLSFEANNFGSALICTESNLNPGDVSHYLFADDVHPTPYGNQLIATLVATGLLFKGWL